MEQGFGDIIQFLRYIPLLQKRGCKITLHCPHHLHRLIDEQGWGVFLLDKGELIAPSELPEHDWHALSFNLPDILRVLPATTRQATTEPYLRCTHPRQDLEGGFKIGICWESGPGKHHDKKSCPLKYFERIAEFGRLYSLQFDVHDTSLTLGAEQLELYGVDGIKDFADTASYIAALDAVVSVDTATLHLAGAMGVKTIGMLGREPDMRWKVGDWYPCVTLIDGDETARYYGEDWGKVLDQVYKNLV